MSISKIIKAWEKASDDLKITIQTPLMLTTEYNQIIEFELLIDQFGSKLGTIIFSIDNMTKINMPKTYGYYYSALNPVSYEKYDRQLFIDTLNDWGYFGDKLKTPVWYSGKPWTD